MSVTFTASGERSDLDRPETFVNLANQNAQDVLIWLGVGPELYGEISARELAALCKRRLKASEQNQDDGREAIEVGRLTVMGRRLGYLPEKARDLLALCERAERNGKDLIRWG